MPSLDPACRCCEIAADLNDEGGGLKSVGRRWTLYRNLDAARPALVLQCRRHVAHLGELTRAEADEIAQVLPLIDEALRAATGAVRTHVVLLAEAMPSHVHWHFVPRFTGEEGGLEGVALLGVPAPMPEPPNVAAMVAKDVRDAIRGTARPPEPASVVRWFVSLTDRVQRRMPYDQLLRRWRPALPRDPHPPSFPQWLERWLKRRGRERSTRRSADAATVYVGLWMIGLASIAAVAGLAPEWWGVPVLAAAAAARAIDVGSFQLRYLLDRRQSFLESFERTLLFLGCNIAEMVLALGVILVAWVDRAPGEAFREAFGIVTLTDAPSTPEVGAFLLRITFTAISITLLAGAGGVILGLVGRDVEEAPHETKPRGVASDDAPAARPSRPAP